MIIQCDSGHLNSDLIACVRYRVCDEAIRAKTLNKIHGRDDITHVLLVIRLPQQEVKSQFVGFQGDPWISVHIGDLRPTSEATVIPERAVNAFISELFIGHHKNGNEIEASRKESVVLQPHGLSIIASSEKIVCEPLVRDSAQPQDNASMMMDIDDIAKDTASESSPTHSIATHLDFSVQELNCTVFKQTVIENARKSIPLHPQHRRLHGCVQAAVSLLKDSRRDRAVLRIQKLMALIPKAPPEQLGK